MNVPTYNSIIRQTERVPYVRRHFLANSALRTVLILILLVLLEGLPKILVGVVTRGGGLLQTRVCPLPGLRSSVTDILFLCWGDLLFSFRDLPPS